MISLALDEVDAADKHWRLRGNADAGLTELIVPMISALADWAVLRR